MAGQHEKIFGLDVMRTAAGVMVLLSHTGHLVEQHWPQFPNVPHVDWVGLFFVLSGFLIGGTLLDSLAQPSPAPLRFADFMQRRWLRTLPNYFLFLLLNIALVHFSLAPGLLTHATPAYAVFMQNFHVPLDLFFWESWSLAVEEWFYLLFPLIAFSLVALAGLRGGRSYLVACALFILLPVAGRFSVMHHVVDDMTRALWVQKMVITRLDAPGMGMLAALIARRFPAQWLHVRWPALLLGLAALLFFSKLHYADAPRFMVIGYESTCALAMALLLPLLSTWRSAGSLNGPMRGLSLITYSLYLVHLPMLYLCGKFVPDGSAWKCALHYGLFIGGCMAVATFVYRCWERPFMRLRDPFGRWLAKHWNRSWA